MASGPSHGRNLAFRILTSPEDLADAAIPDCAMKGVSYADPHVLTLNGGQPNDPRELEGMHVPVIYQAFTSFCFIF